MEKRSNNIPYLTWSSKGDVNAHMDSKKPTAATNAKVAIEYLMSCKDGALYK